MRAPNKARLVSICPLGVSIVHDDGDAAPRYLREDGLGAIGVLEEWRMTAPVLRW